jgi:hypothetical protein
MNMDIGIFEIIAAIHVLLKGPPNNSLKPIMTRDTAFSIRKIPRPAAAAEHPRYGLDRE